MGNEELVLDSREVRDSQDPMGMTLAKIPNNEEIQPVQTTSSRLKLDPVEGWSHPHITKFLTQKCSCTMERQGQKMEQRLKERPAWDCPNPTLSPWSRGACGEEPGEVRPATDQCRGGCLEPTIRLNSGNLVGELAEGLEELRGIATQLEEEHWLS